MKTKLYYLLSAVMLASILLSACGPATTEVPAPTEAPKAAEPKKIDRDSSTTVGYALAAIGTVIVMLLICMPARRE